MKSYLVAASILAAMPIAGTATVAFAQGVQPPQGQYLSQERPENRIHAPLKSESQPQGNYLSQERPEDRIHAPLKTEGNSQPAK